VDSNLPKGGSGKQDGCKEVSSAFVVAGCDTAEMLQLKEALDQVALPIHEVVDRALDLAVGEVGMCARPPRASTRSMMARAS
jgi:hypothetical protein